MKDTLMKQIQERNEKKEIQWKETQQQVEGRLNAVTLQASQLPHEDL